MNEGFNNLYCAIFEQAVVDDVNLISKMLVEELNNTGTKLEEAYMVVKQNKKIIEEKVKKIVCQEALEYPKVTAGQAHQNRRKIFKEILKLIETGG